MKQGNNNRRGRGRGQRKPHGMGGPHGGGAGKGNQTFDSNGPDIRVRGNAHQVLEKYLQMARDAGVAGDRVAAENYLQHAEHYYRVIAAQTEGQRPRIGGRELSVADVNVQNVSQGLSAALYAAPVSAAGLPADALPGNGDQAGAPVPNGNYADEEGEQFSSFNGQGRRDHGNRDHGNREQGAADSRGSEGRASDGRNIETRGEGRNGPRRHQRSQGRDGQGRDGQGRDGQRYDGQRFAGAQGGFQVDGHAEDAAPVRTEGRPSPENAQPSDSYNRPAEGRPVEKRGVDRAADEQPDYPSELLAQPVVAAPAVQLPEAQPSLPQPSLPLTSGEETPAADDTAEAAPVRRGRGRPRGTTAPRRTRSAASPDGEANVSAPTDGGE